VRKTHANIGIHTGTDTDTGVCTTRKPVFDILTHVAVLLAVDVICHICMVRGPNKPKGKKWDKKAEERGRLHSKRQTSVLVERSSVRGKTKGR
jgi:hypothetical protein